jgi:hypothetical protein
MKLFSIVVLCGFYIFLPLATQAADTCESLRKDYAKKHQTALGCLESSTSCEVNVTGSVLVAKALFDCLPEPPPNKGSGYGAFNLSLGLDSPADCKSEGDAWEKAATLYTCLARWNDVADWQYKHKLPEDDCSKLIAPFILARDTFQACVARKRLGKSVKMKVKF